MATETISARYAGLDLWPTGEAVLAMAEGQMAAAAAVQSQAQAIADAADAAAARLRDGRGRLIYIGAGTSGRVAVQDGVELGPTYSWESERVVYALAGGMEALLSSVEGAEDDEATGADAVRRLAPSPSDVAIGVAASGRTPYTLAALRTAAEAGALTVGVASNPATPLLAAAAHPILLDTGPEIVAGSTRMKAGTAQKIALNLLSTAIMLRLGRVYDGLMVDMRVSNRKLGHRALAMVERIAGVGPEAADQALAQADGRIKVAVLIAMGANPSHAAKLLRETGDDLREAIARTIVKG